MQKLNIVDIIALVLVVVGGVNWGLVGLLDLDVVAAVLGVATLLTRLVYILVGVAAVYLAVVSMKLERK
jgi:uncharacterized protein